MHKNPQSHVWIVQVLLSRLPLWKRWSSILQRAALFLQNPLNSPTPSKSLKDHGYGAGSLVFLKLICSRLLGKHVTERRWHYENCSKHKEHPAG